MCCAHIRERTRDPAELTGRCPVCGLHPHRRGALPPAARVSARVGVGVSVRVRVSIRVGVGVRIRHYGN